MGGHLGLLCCPDASHYVSVQSNLGSGGDVVRIILKMSAMSAVLEA